MDKPPDPSPEHGPWNPGLRSQVPDDLLHLATIFRPGNVETTLAEAHELRDLSGLALDELVVFRPRRLALHELLVRVTADISVPDGSRIEDLGINFRHITRVLLEGYVEPRMDDVERRYDDVRRGLEERIAPQARVLFDLPGDADASGHTHHTRAAPSAARGLFGWLRRAEAGPAAAPRKADPPPTADQLIELWQRVAADSSEPLERAALRALSRVASALIVRHGALWGNPELVTRLAVNLALADAGSDAIGQLIAPWIADGAQREGYAFLPRQDRPVVMNTKGASASGKSTLRPLQKALAGRIGVSWDEFALVSPDIWRKQLLDYATLGPAYKYGGAFTGDELRIVDEKLDRYMAEKGRSGNMPHLLIDRFRFDSFAADSNEAGSNLLTRFGEIVYLFFMITPPASLVERAWNRGLEFGRYKAVDDTLAHAVEAYSGMPEVFFTWLERSDKEIHYEFLDNSVAQGEVPRTVAFGSNGALNILDPGRLLDVDRFRRVDIEARRPSELFPAGDLLAAERNVAFLRACVARCRTVTLADQRTGIAYLHIADGLLQWTDPPRLEAAMDDADARAAILAVAPSLAAQVPGAPTPAPAVALEPGSARTLGVWGSGQKRH